MKKITKTPLYLIHSLKTALVYGLVSLLLAALHLEYKQWVLITIIVVMSAQNNVGSFLKKAKARFLGTVMGAAISILTLVIVGHDTYTIILIGTLSCALFSFLAVRYEKWLYAGVLGAVTVSIVLTPNDPSIKAACIRIVEVLAGIFFASVGTMLIFPIRAQDFIKRNLAINLQEFAALFNLSVIEKKPREFHVETEQLDAKAVKHLVEIRTLINESAIEWRCDKNTLNANKAVFHHHKMLQRYVNLIEFYYHADPEIHALVSSIDSFHILCQQLVDALNQLSLYIMFNQPISFDELNTTFSAFSAAADVSHFTKKEQIWLLHAFLFAFSRMIRILELYAKNYASLKMLTQNFKVNTDQNIVSV